jgi:hypothetical protein
MVYPLAMIEYLYGYKKLMVWLSSFSILLFLFSLAALPCILAKIPENYFFDLARGTGEKPKQGRASLKGIFLGGARAVIGTSLVIGGFIMLFIPGQGLLTILAGLMLMDFPGKTRLILLLVGHPGIRKGANWIREKKGVPPFRFPG